MTLRLKDIGIATAYATVVVGDVEPEMENAAGAADRLRKLEKKGAETETIFLLGQADIANIYETSNFMRVFDLHYPQARSNASVVNWVFSVPYEGTRSGPPDAGFRFILHLRFRRSVYGFTGVEERIFAKLRELLGTHAKDARFHAGLGWSDLIIDGTFTPRTFETFARFIIQVHSLAIRFRGEGDPIPVLQRMLTLIGYTGEPPRFRNNSHLTFLRAKPGRYGDVLRRLRPNKTEVVYALDGKADFLMISRRTAAQWLKRQRELGQEKNRELLRKVETHLMFFPAKDFLAAAEDESLNIEIDQPFDRDNCGCRNTSKTAIDEIESAMTEAGKFLRAGQQHAIDNTLFLLASALRDASICCDAVDAALGSYDGLLSILRSMAKLPSVEDPSERYQYTVSLWARLDDWHRFSELLLRQRTVGSYEEILGQSDRSVVYSGGVQKFLYLADQLVAEFARRINPQRPLRFATIYDSVKTIFSHRIGVVRVPTSKMFAFPHVVADLWHEVAGTLFFLRKGRAVAQHAPARERHQFLERLADHYADLLVYLYGFGGDFDRFITSLAHGWKATYADTDEVVQRWTIGEFLLRAYLVFEFGTLRDLQSDEKSAESFLEPEQAWKLVNRLRKVLKSKCPFMSFRHTDWDVLRRNIVTQDFSAYHRDLYHDFLRVPARSIAADIQPFLRGDIAELNDSDDLNDLFGELSHAVATRKTEAFRAMAALGKSAAIECYRRQVLRRAKTARARSGGVEDPEGRDAPTEEMKPGRTRRRVDPTTRYSRGAVIGDWKIENYVASGKMGDVYRATHRTLRNDVALKITKVGATNDDLERMLDEVRLGRKVHHPNVCSIYTVKRLQHGRIIIEMEYIDGENFASVIRRMAPFSMTRGSKIAAAMFDGLKAIHAAEPPIVHRDLKPANIMLDEKGTVRILDFGLAILAGNRQLEWAGTKDYMAPEVLAFGPATTASDVYSAGLVLLELFTGTPVPELRAARRKHGNWDAVPGVAKIPARGRKLILRCLEEQPPKRPSARELYTAWNQLARSGSG